MILHNSAIPQILFTRLQANRYAMVVLVLFVVCLSAVSDSVFATRLSASLSVDEQQFVSTVAGLQAWQQSRSLKDNQQHLLDIQTLSIELYEQIKNKSQRRAVLYQFNYNLQQSRLILVDLDIREVIGIQTIETVHLPLNEHEIATARSIIEQQPEIMRAINKEQASRGLPDLPDLSEIDFKVSIYEPNDATHLCATQRCALVSLFDRTRTVFALEPLVNLQRLSVTTLQGGF